MARAAYLRFGSWIGGDRDGNPSVTADVTWQTLRMQRKLAVREYQHILSDLFKHLSFCTTIIDVTDELMASIQRDRLQVKLQKTQQWNNEKEPYRIKLTYMVEKLHNLLDDAKKDTSERYANVSEFIEDLKIIDRSLRHHYADYVADTHLKKLIRQVELFGFHTATLDVRQHSKEHENAMTEILANMNIVPNYSELEEEEKVKLLEKLLNDPRPLTSPYQDYSESTNECLEVYRAIYRAQQEYGKQCITSYLISMTEAASDILEVMVLPKKSDCSIRKRTAA
ncbi:hypothetical protein HMSSN036_68100 [Paenibacillus macerans]|nr:hypothetical protein HMSSN036_68100 [Paenibacillus macerans]